MSALGDRLRGLARDIRGWHVNSQNGSAQAIAYEGAAVLADEYEAAALAESAQGRGPHAASALRWAASRAEAPAAFGVGVVGLLRQWADEAERSPVRVEW